VSVATANRSDMDSIAIIVVAVNHSEQEKQP